MFCSKLILHICMSLMPTRNLFARVQWYSRIRVNTPSKHYQGLQLGCSMRTWTVITLVKTWIANVRRNLVTTSVRQLLIFFSLSGTQWLLLLSKTCNGYCQIYIRLQEWFTNFRWNVHFLLRSGNNGWGLDSDSATNRRNANIFAWSHRLRLVDWLSFGKFLGWKQTHPCIDQHAKIPTAGGS